MARVVDPESPAEPREDAPEVVAPDAQGDSGPANAAAYDPKRHRLTRFVRTHALFLSLIAVGTALRVIVMIAYQPAIIYNDSPFYLAQAAKLKPGPYRPFGYSALLAIAIRLHSLLFVPIVQHLIGIGLAIGIYVLLQRLGAPRWLSALATIPVLFDSIQLSLEQYVMSDTLFEAFLLALLLLLLWNRRPGPLECMAIGLLLAAAALIRFDSLDLGVLVLGYLAFCRIGVRRAVVFLVAFALPVLAYGTWYKQTQGPFTLSTASGAFLYSRVAPIADCSRFTLPPDEKAFCPPGPLSQRQSSSWYMWNYHSPVWTVRNAHGEKYRPEKLNKLLRSFAITVIEHEPVQYAHLVLADYFSQFLPTRAALPNRGHQFAFAFTPRYPLKDFAQSTIDQYFKGDGIRVAVVAPLASFLSSYSRYVYLPGPAFALLLILAFLAAIGLGRARRTHVRQECLLLGALGVCVLLFAVSTASFAWRYVLPELIVLPTAGALGLAALLGWVKDVPERMSPAATKSAVETGPAAPADPATEQGAPEATPADGLAPEATPADGLAPEEASPDAPPEGASQEEAAEAASAENLSQ